MNTRHMLDTNDGNSQLRPLLLAVAIFVLGVAVSLVFTGLPN